MHQGQSGLNRTHVWICQLLKHY